MKKAHKVLIIDDDRHVRYTLGELLEANGFDIAGAPDGKDGLEAVRASRPEVVLLDLLMPGMDGFATLKGIKELDSSIPVIMISAHGDIPAAVEAVKAGAFDFLPKPPDMDALCLKIRSAIDKASLERDVVRLQHAVGSSIERFLGKSEAVKRVISQIDQVAPSDFSVIIDGETGTGKSTVAEIIHNMSRRGKGPFMRVDLGTIPDTLIESELFGCEKGAFTGAEKARRGFFHFAHESTIFLDELENTSESIQTKLLGVVEQKKFFPMGSAAAVDVDIRVITATNRDIRKLVAERKVREDLFFRLGEFIITLPPLRERLDDIEYLAGRFLLEVCEELNKDPMKLSSDSVEMLMRYPWPGNVRELKNVIRRAALISNAAAVRPGDIEFLVGTMIKGERPVGHMPLKEVAALAAHDAEKAAIAHAMQASGGNKTKAASILRVDYKTLLTKIKQYALE